MSLSAARLLYWSPRIIAILFVLFLSAFALDAFNEFHVFWKCLLAFVIGLLPAAIVAVSLAAAWRWEWIGAAAFALLGTWYSWNALHRHFLSWPIFLAIPLPLFFLALLFLANWIERAKLRAAH